MFDNGQSETPSDDVKSVRRGLVWGDASGSGVMSLPNDRTSTHLDRRTELPERGV